MIEIMTCERTQNYSEGTSKDPTRSLFYPDRHPRYREIALHKSDANRYGMRWHLRVDELGCRLVVYFRWSLMDSIFCFRSSNIAAEVVRFVVWREQVVCSEREASQQRLGIMENKIDRRDKSSCKG